ncbi:MAG: type IV pilin-like G/H family protein [Microcoleaceae cyanobacterium]
MKTEFKAKFLQHVANKRKEEGFTLIELLVVIIIIGILSAIALPSFLNQANKAKQSEAKQYLSSISKGIQAHYAESSTFKFIIDPADPTKTRDLAITDLGLGIKTQTTNYKYELGKEAKLGEEQGVVSTAKPASVALLAYAGGVSLVPAGTDKSTTSVLCQQQASAGEFTATVANPEVKTGRLVCGTGQTEVTK